MNTRGDTTRARLLEATRDVVRRLGYSNATTRAIAEAAGIAEGTIYRHFPDKVALFFAAAMTGNEATLDALASLPDQAGERTVTTNLTEALTHLTELRRDLVPLELALRTDPDLARRRETLDAPVDTDQPLPPHAIVLYLRREQDLGRVREDLDPTDTALVLLAALFGLGLTRGSDTATDDSDLVSTRVATFVELVTRGIAT